jgi:hypothetical protein
MAVQEIRTFKQIQDAIMDRGKITDNAASRNKVKEKINTTYVRTGYEEFYRWSGKTLPITLAAKYTTGKLSATNGSDILTEDASNATSWVENDHRYCRIQIGSDGVPHRIVRVDDVSSPKTMTIEAPYTGETNTSTTYTIYRDEIPMFPDFQDVRSVTIPGVPFRKQPQPVGPIEMEEDRIRHPFYQGTPRKYTMWGMGIYTAKTWEEFNIGEDFWEDSLDTDQPRNPTMVIWPSVQTSDTIIYVRYTMVIYPMNQDADEPLIPYENRPVLVYGTLWEHFLENRDISTKREWERQYRMYKKKMASDIERTDEQLILKVDRRNYSRYSRYATIYDENVVRAD